MNAQPAGLLSFQDFYTNIFPNTREFGRATQFGEIDPHLDQRAMAEAMYKQRYGSFQPDGAYAMPINQYTQSAMPTEPPPVGPGPGTPGNQPMDPASYMQAQMNLPNYEQRIVGMAGVPGLQSQLDIMKQMGLGGLLG